MATLVNPEILIFDLSNYTRRIDIFVKKATNMETIIVTPKNKKAIPFLKHLLSSLDDVDKVEVINLSHNKTEKSIEAGLKDLQDIILGKKNGKPLKQLLDED